MGSAAPQPLAKDGAYLDGLNPEQAAAVTAPDGPLLVLAGAGTGKTRVLTTRLAHVLASGRAMPGEVLAVTFTNKAAREMVERVGKLLGRSVEGLWLGTFHSIGARMLRRHAELAGLKPSFTILDTDDQLRLLKQVIEAANLDERRWAPRVLMGIVQRWKDRGYPADGVPAAEVGDFALGRTVELYQAYQARLQTLNACDFGDLLLLPLELLRRNPDVLESYQRRFKAILVDEYQDTNVAQYLWLRLLAQKRKNITCVGDDDQSIYSWRGAEVGNILRFEQDFPGSSVIRLERNYRSKGNILGAASGLIARNQARHGKTLWTEDEGGPPVRVAGLWDDSEEARFIGEEIEAWQRKGGSLSQCAVLVRAGFQTRSLEERFLQMGLPYRIIGGLRFYERAHIRDAVAYLRLVAQPADDLAFERIVNKPRRGIGDQAIKSLHRLARGGDEGMPLLEAARRLAGSNELATRTRNALQGFVNMVDAWRAEVQDIEPRELTERVLEESGYTQMWQNDRNPDAPGKLDDLKELTKAIEEFPTLGAFLEHVSLVMDVGADPDADKASVMTLHGAKGLEFGNVFLAGWEEGLFPSQRSVDEGGVKALEEERRLAYVGITRARQNCTISFAASRKVYGQWQTSVPSRFIEELPQDHVEHLHRNPALRPDLDSHVEFEEAPLAPRVAPFRSRKAAFNALSGSKVIEGKAEILHKQPRKKANRFKGGERIFHQKFGYGRVDSVEGDKLDIEFEKAGRKKVIQSFVEPA